MSNVEKFPVPARQLTEYEALVAAAPSALDAIPGAVYLCDHDGLIVRYNREATELWGREPQTEEVNNRYCGAISLFDLNGKPLPHDQCAMAETIETGHPIRNAEVVIQRPDGSRISALVNVRPLRDHNGVIQGAINCFQDITSRKNIEEEVQRKNRDLEDFFENSAIGLHIVNGEGLIVRANKAELDLLGYTAEEYFGRQVADFHADASVIEDILKRLSCGEMLDRYPARLQAKDGSIKHVLITSNSRFVDGAFNNTRCFTTDVTDLYHSEAARRESDERLAATYEAATIAIAEADEQGQLLRVNDALCKILGRSREQLLSMSFFEFTHEDDRQEDAILYASQIRGEMDSYSVRKRAIKPDGEISFLDVFSSSVRDANGNFQYGVRVIQDVTAAKIMEDRLRDGERHLRDLLEALPAAVYTTDSRGHIKFFNRAAVEMAGRVPQPDDEWCVTWRLYRPDGTPLPHDQCPMAVTLKENRPVRGEEAIAERPDGSRIPFIPYPTPLRDANGNLVGAINMLVDISERKDAENRQKLLIDELNHRVKNNLATVQALAGQTARHAEGLEDFLPTFEARLLALARAHDLLTKRHWQHAPLGTLIREVVTPVTGDTEERLRIKGPSVDLNPRAALSFTMALNELATNAAKYGALSSEAGFVSIRWSIEEESAHSVLNLSWREFGGPQVIPPKRRGFGTRLMERCIERDLNGEFDLEFEAEGVHCRIAIPKSQLGERV